MTTVDLPNGDTIQFPDGTPSDTILKVVEQHVGASGFCRPTARNGPEAFCRAGRTHWH